MKKILTLLLLFVGIAGTASATRTRLYIYMVDNWKNYAGGTKIYTWDSQGNKYTGDYNTSANNMHQIGSTNWFFIDADFPETINMILISGNGDGWKSADILNVTIKDKYLKFSSDANGTAFNYTSHDLKYYLYNADGTTIEMTSTDGNIFTGEIDNQTSPRNDEYFIAPSFVTDNYASDDGRWYYVLRPWDEHQNLQFENVTDYECGFYKAQDGNNSNSLKTNNIPAHFVFTFDATAQKYSVSPYFTRTLPAAAEGYATFSSAYNVAIPAGLTAQYATGVSGTAISWANYSGGIAANQGALLHGTAGQQYTFTPTASVTDPTTNLLKPVGSKIQVAQTVNLNSDSYTNFILTKKTTNDPNDDALGFYKVNASGSWCAAGTAYLQVLTSQLPAQGANVFFSLFGEEVTGINAVNMTNDNQAVYDLQGRRVANPTRGLYIVNGKKVVLK